MKVSDKTVQSLRILIEQTHMQVGDRLPAERKLCEQLGVSRSSLREAISQLSSMGMLLSKVGAGLIYSIYLIIGHNIKLYSPSAN